MKHLFTLLIVLMVSNAFAQDGFVETKYSRNFSFAGTNRIQHSVNEIDLDDESLSELFQGNALSYNLLENGRRDKRIGVPLNIAGGVGLIASLVLINRNNINSNETSFQTHDWVFLSSIFVETMGSLYINSYLRNRLRAVNNYNRTQFEEMGAGNMGSFIELEYGQTPFRYFSYIQDGHRMNNHELTDILAEDANLKDIILKANRQRGIGVGLVTAGGVGLVAGTVLLFENERAGLVVGGASFVSLISGSILLNASRANRQSAVNLYNRQLFQSASGMSNLHLNLNPTNGGVVLNF
ncbi:hypothetical protein KI659_08105 [Litoribacter alkaliphilus]|uniref:Uncharacterized protein n=1 Tax=Litoribacter ruber TaxID=702568 RepID=A0AAP2CIP4_9BACT|nr:hypothetical protein [Litoribacter alkaliphilus]MBS9523976.1 hypothetical protein [Litoribacter alkaliphilus]